MKIYRMNENPKNFQAKLTKGKEQKGQLQARNQRGTTSVNYLKLFFLLKTVPFIINKKRNN